MNEPLKTATAVVGLLAGVVAGLYVLGGLVIALRLLFDHYTLTAVVSIVGQLPREPVIATALIDVLGPAAIVGLVFALIYSAFGRPRARQEAPQGQAGRGEGKGRRRRWLREFSRKPAVRWIGLVLLALLLAWPGAYAAYEHEGPAPGWRLIVGAVLVLLVLLLCRELKERVVAAPWSQTLKAFAAGGLWSLIVLIPMLSLTSALPFERAQACLGANQEPIEGRLIGEGGSRILIEEQFGKEAGVVVLHADQVALSEYGDLSSRFACPPPPGAEEAAPEPELGGHGSELEQELATRLRPRLRFDGEEPWRPISVSAFLAEEFTDGKRHELCEKGSAGTCEPLRSSNQLLRGPGEAGYIDIHGEGKNGSGYEAADPKCIEDGPEDDDVLDCNAGPGAVMYYRRTSHEGRWYWDYWWFYRYNDYKGVGDACDSIFCGDHEGDWEGITVVTTATVPAEIVGAIYAAHAQRVLIRGSELPRAGNHPLVFVAKGTHASYPFWCAGDCRQYRKVAGERLPETHHDGAVAWGANSDAECAEHTCVRPLPEVGKPGQKALPLAAAWAGWPGMWGGTCFRRCEHVAHGEASPRSPGLQARFRGPWAVTHRALPNADNSGLSRSEKVGDANRLISFCAAQHGGL